MSQREDLRHPILTTSGPFAEGVATSVPQQRPFQLWAHVSRANRYLPGIMLVAGIAVPAKLIENSISTVPAVVVAMVLGIIITNSVVVPGTFQAGIKFTSRYLLRLAIILLGASLSFAAVFRTGAQTLVIILICVVLAFGLSLLLSRAFKLSSKIGTLIGAGTAICGATAIVTCGPFIKAKDEETAYAIATIFTFNIIAVILYPIIGAALHLSDLAFGTWSGTAINDTSAVVAAGYVFSSAAGAVATVVKLTRTVMLVPLAVVVGLAPVLLSKAEAERDGPKVNFLKIVPWFVFGFLAMASLNSLGLFTPAVVKASTEVAKFLIVMVLAAVGLGVSFAGMRRVGPRPFLIGMLVAVLMAGISLTLVHLGGI